MAELLLKGGANPDYRPRGRGRTPLHEAARLGHAKMVKYLIGKGADVDARDTDRLTPILHACLDGQVEAAKALIEAGADLTVTSSQSGQTPHEIAMDAVQDEVHQRQPMRVLHELDADERFRALKLLLLRLQVMQLVGALFDEAVGRDQKAAGARRRVRRPPRSTVRLRSH